jgi:hypothetical protein
VTAGADLAGTEVQLYDPAGRELTHTVVHERRVDGRTVYAGVFPSVREGRYRLGAPGGPVHDVEVRGGAVTSVTLTPL